MTLVNWRRLHAAADGLDRRLRGVISRVRPIERGWIALLDILVARQSDRRYMRRIMLPAIARAAPSRVLFVGVRSYTKSYQAVLQKSGTEFWTCDIDPAAARFGAPDRHVTGDARRLDALFAPCFFDMAMLNGLFGWGVDLPEDMDRVLAAAAEVLRPGAPLLVGWNHDRSPDPDTLPSIALFAPAGFAGLPQRQEFAGVTHRYAWYRKQVRAMG